MPITNVRLDTEIQIWRDYAVLTPQRIRPRELLKQRGTNMPRGLGITTAAELARHMVEARAAASMEMTMGSLYERLLQALGPERVTREQRRIPGYIGIDFINRTPDLIEVINLKTGLSTTNNDITQNSRRHLLAARDYWKTNQGADDNPLPQELRQIVMVRAVARGGRRRSCTGDEILHLVGESMWRHFGSGEHFLARLGAALDRNPIDLERYEEQKGRATHRVYQYLMMGGFADGEGRLDWDHLADMFP